MHSNDTITPDPIPYGCCHCGCGGKTTIAPQTSTDRGWVRGEPIRFIHGHNSFKEDVVLDENSTKVCGMCGRDLSVSLFGKKSRNKDGLNIWCKECAATYHREYYKGIRDVHQKRTASWRKRNPDAAKAIKRTRQARERGGRGRVTHAEWQNILDRFNGRCAKCGSEDSIEMDHVVPLSKGGTHSPDNIQPLCCHCNRSKSTKTEDYRGSMYTTIALPID